MFVIAAMITVLVVEAIWFLTYKRYVRSTLRYSGKIGKTGYVTSYAVAAVLYSVVVWLLVKCDLIRLVSGLLLVVPLFVLMPFQFRLIKRESQNFTNRIKPLSDSRLLRHYTMMYLLICVMASPWLYLGVEKSLECLFPSITVVKLGEKRFSSEVVYGWPEGRKVSLGEDYLLNNTQDTLFRVLVIYAIPGEDLRHNYALTDSVPPGDFMKIKGRADFCMRRIPPFRKWSVTKMGNKVRCQTAFIVNRPQLSLFQNYDLYPIGLKRSLKVKSIKEQSRNIWEDTVEKRKLEHKIESYLLRKSR